MMCNRGSMLVLFALAWGCRSARLQQFSHKKRIENPGSNVFPTMGNFLNFGSSVYQTMTADGILEIVQMDHTTASRGTRAFSFNTGERKGLITGWYRTAYGFGMSLPIHYGGALKIAVGETGKVQVANFYRTHITNPAGTAPFQMHSAGMMGTGGIQQKQHISYFPDEVICEASFSQLAIGRRYAYLGGCRFIDVTPDNVPNTMALLPAICEGLDEDRFEECASFFFCALDELKFTPDPEADFLGTLHGASSRVVPRRTCDPNGIRPGLQHALETCFDPNSAEASNCEAQGTCAYCGEQGLCCKHPGYERSWFGSYNQSLKNDGCEERGCSGRFCCVDGSRQETME